MSFVPISYTLQECRDYELVITVPGGDSWEWWVESTPPVAFDIGGAIRVRDASANGNPANFALPHMEVVGASIPSPGQVSDFAGTGVLQTSANSGQERGIFVHMLDTAQLCSFGFEANLVAGQTLTAQIFSATGTTRGSLVATGTYTVPSSGLQWHDVPINFQLLEGTDYNIGISFGAANSWPWWDENAMTEPFTVGAFSVVTSELGGNPANFALPHFRAKWETKTGGANFDLRKITDTFLPSQTAVQPNSDYGAYVTSLVDQQVYSVGWEADVPAGQSTDFIPFDLYYQRLIDADDSKNPRQGRGLADLLHRGQQQPNEDGDDRDHHQQLDQSERESL
jgi:hypothetical protein